MKKSATILMCALMLLAIIAVGCSYKNEPARQTAPVQTVSQNTITSSQQNTAPAPVPVPDDKDLQTASDDFSTIDQVLG